MVTLLSLLLINRIASYPALTPQLAKFEPARGCYLGAFVARELIPTGKTLHIPRKTLRLANGAVIESDAWDGPEYREAGPASFAKAVGKRHAFFFSYFQYDSNERPLRDFLGKMKREGCGAQVAVEPKTMDEVKDDAHLHRLVSLLRDAKIPVFLRFASEMNGNWVTYSGNPTLYRERFRLLAKVVHAEAPNVAVVWCPSSTPVGPIDSYFPGYDYVDWVGVNFYSVLNPKGKPQTPDAAPHPALNLDYVYRKYSPRHPIMVCEWGATHRSALDNVERPEFAETQIARLYSCLPRQYPRVKAVSWFSMNAIALGPPGKRSNDYSVLDNERVKTAYAKAIRDPYYLGEVAARK